MTTTIEELTTPLTVDECSTAIYDALAARGVDTTAWKSGSVVRTIIAGLAVVLYAFSRLQSLIAQSGFLDKATGDWLTLIALYVFGVTRNTGSFAAGNVTVDNSGGGVYSGVAGDLIFVSSTTGQAYRNTAAYSIAAFETGVVIAVQAVELGSAGTAAASTIDTFQTALTGLTVTNTAALVGADPESDAALRERCRDKTAAASPNGPSDAYAYFAKSSVRADGTSIGVTRVNTVPDGAGGVDVYVATASGGVTGSAGSPTTDLGIIDDDIHTNVEPIAITPTVQSATALSIAVTYELWIRNNTGLTDAEIETLISDALTSFMAEQPIGGIVISPSAGAVYVSAIEGAITGALPDGSLIKLTVTAPAADVLPASNEAPVAGAVTATAIHQIAGNA